MIELKKINQIIESAKEFHLFQTSAWIYPPASDEEAKMREAETAALIICSNRATTSGTIIYKDQISNPLKRISRT